MIGRCLGPQKLRRIQRTLRHFKVTILCLVLTVVVLRGTIGAGKFGTPEQDFLQIRHRFTSRKRADPHRLLVELETTSFEPDPRVSDWDEQRRKWLENNGKSPGYIRPEKPPVLLVTGSSSKPCENLIGDRFLLKSIKNKMDYCRLHGIEILHNSAIFEAEMAGFRAKLPLMRKLLLSHPEVEFLWWMDSDAIFTDMEFEIPWERYRDYNFVMHGWKETDQKNWIGLNSGSFLLRNCQWSLDILEARPALEADDKWGNKIFVEKSYYKLVNRFVGCKPCEKFGDDWVERCLKEMERALDSEKIGRENGDELKVEVQSSSSS